MMTGNVTCENTIGPKRIFAVFCV